MKGSTLYSSSISILLRALLFHISLGQNSRSPRQDILRGLLNGTGLLYDARVPPNFEENIATDVSVQIYVMSFDSLTEISMVNSWWGLPSTVRAISGKELVHPHQSHFLHHYLHLKHSYTGDRARSAGSHSSGAVPDSHYTQSSRHSKGHGISRNGHLFVSVRGGGVGSGPFPYLRSYK
ncbi:hypothetical protein RRG08_025438 [Elysia crispata]|uniref:Uncharacterized protein n=1 Tax=Elysia crispata TaxID=231223 RepID=A0AAE0Z8U6_9GAST|nr:hypothetical protein RRG08_025438 [Elysia crispata]